MIWRYLALIPLCGFYIAVQLKWQRTRDAKNTKWMRAVQCAITVAINVWFLVMLSRFGADANVAETVESIIYIVVSPLLLLVSFNRERTQGPDDERKRGETTWLFLLAVVSLVRATRMLLFGDTEWTLNHPMINRSLIVLFVAGILVCIVIPAVLLIVIAIRKKRSDRDDR
ncbi:MAG: hypothetical protein LBN02_07540 [Oscillospiraceae bacterium]|jgi:integral membrane sensor domain MASE1|nr:hypothetical protein [Oscillospiraceae bacterium]